MELSQEDIELIDRYNNGELTGDELASFNERIKNPDFASAVSMHSRAVDIIKHGGRNELRNLSSSIQSKLEATKGFEKYTPGKTSGGSMWSWVIMGVIIATASYFYFTGKIKPEQIKQLFRDEAVDTAYHYIYHTDTIYRINTDTVIYIKTDTLLPGEQNVQTQTRQRKIIRIDTVYQSTKGVPVKRSH